MATLDDESTPVAPGDVLGAVRNATRSLAAILALSLSTGCYHYHVTGNRVTPATEPESATQVAYLWGAVQPNDIVPDNCPKKVPLAEVTAHTNLGYVLLGTVTLGTVVIHRIEWRCAKLQSGGGVSPGGGGVVPGESNVFGDPEPTPSASGDKPKPPVQGGTP